MRRQLVLTVLALIAPVLLNIGYEFVVLLCLACVFVLLGSVSRGVYLLPVAGLIFSVLNLINLKSISLPEAFLGRTIVVDLNVEQIKKSDAQVRMTGVLVSPLMLRGYKVRLNWHRPEHQSVAGDVWRMSVKLKSPWGFVNPGAFDYQGFLLRQGISATGYVKTKYPVYKVKDSDLHFRPKLNQALSNALAGLAQSSLLRTLIDGNKDQVTDDQWQILQNTGTLHLFIVSGLHIGIMFLLGRALLLWFFRPFVLLMPDLSVRQLSLLGGLLLALAYGYMAGFTLPIVRSLSMLFTAVILFLFKRNLPVSVYWLSSMLVVLMVDPLAVFFAGFWLSFIAVGVLIGAFSGYLNMARLNQMILPQWAVVLGLMPVLLILSLPVAPQSLLANFVAVPLVTLLLLPALFFEVCLVVLRLPQPELLLWLIDYLMSALWWLLTLLSGLPRFYFADARLIWPLAFIAVLLIFVMRGLNYYLLPVVVLCCFFIWPKSRLQAGEYNLWVLDVGQGQSLLIETSDHYLLYDVGGKYGESFSAAKVAVLPFLRRLGIDRLDMLVISHNDRDHSGDYRWLNNQLEVGRHLSGQPEYNGGVGCAGYPDWIWDGVLFEFAPATPEKKDNNQSCILRLSSPAGISLVVGDIEKTVERQLHQWWQPVDVLMAPHHGSNTSSTADFIRQNSPDYVVFSAAKGNHFGHPHNKVVERYEQANVKSLKTWQSGNIRFEFRAGLSPMPAALYRQQSPRFWLSG